MAYDTDIQSQSYHLVDEVQELPIQEMLQLLIKKGLFFVCPLRKGMTRESAFQERISVGRARNQDILLRHHTVSKSHAWFERDEEGVFYVADSGSKNGTLVNGKEIDSHKLIALEAGDRIVFGGVHTLITSAESLWLILQH
ncbi:MAG: FHA domain-containing protein [Deltaproteobacteria bacterium]|nr:FHA domain-containing protein [Deltaproteobacteria bacterium]